MGLYNTLVSKYTVYLFVEDVACVEHADKLCACPGSNKCLRYRYTLEELPHMISQLKKRAEFYDSWSRKAKAALAATGSERLSE